MSIRPERIVIVGAGDCGTRAALQLRTLGFDGAVVLIGDETTEPYERPTLSKSVLTSDVAPPTIATAAELNTAGIEWRGGHVAAHLDPDNRIVELDTGDAVAYDRLLLATGARARKPPIAGGGRAHRVRNLGDAAELRSAIQAGGRIAVVGGGFIGLETAANAVEAGCSVTVVEFAHDLMARVVPAPVAALIHQRHLDAGVDLRIGVGIAHWDQVGEHHRLLLDDGTTIEAEHLLAGVGAIPNTELAATAGLRIENGIAVDQHLRSSDPAIWAAGDCCSFPHPLYGNQRVRIEAWRNAITQAETAATNLLGGEETYSVVPSFWSDQYDLTLQVVGLQQAASNAVVRRRRDGHELHFGLDHTGRVVSASGVAPGTTLARDILAAQRLIDVRDTPSAADLADPDLSLRQPS